VSKRADFSHFEKPDLALTATRSCIGLRFGEWIPFRILVFRDMKCHGFCDIESAESKEQ
jgi:hypothetical protein